MVAPRYGPFMKASDVKLGAVYSARVGRHVKAVRVVGVALAGGWFVEVLDTKRIIRIRTARRFRQLLEAPPAMQAAPIVDWEEVKKLDAALRQTQQGQPPSNNVSA